jgi:hypothetical protein
MLCFFVFFSGINVVHAFQSAVFHGLIVSKEPNIYGSDDRYDERNACVIQKFAGILAKQLLLMGGDIRRKQRRRRRFELRGGRTQLFLDKSDDFLSSQDSSSVAGGFVMMDEDEDEDESVMGHEEERELLGSGTLKIRKTIESFTISDTQI